MSLILYFIIAFIVFLSMFLVIGWDRPIGPALVISMVVAALWPVGIALFLGYFIVEPFL